MRSTILSQFYESEDLRSFLLKMEPEHLRDDLKQELFLVLCELPENKLLDLHQQDHLRFYAVRTVMNMIQSKTSRFYKKFRMPVAQIEDKAIADECPEDFEQTQADLLRSIKDELEKLHWYEKDLFELYLKKGSSYKVQAETDIPRQSVMVTVNKVITHIKEKVKRA